MRTHICSLVASRVLLHWIVLKAQIPCSAAGNSLPRMHGLACRHPLGSDWMCACCRWLHPLHITLPQTINPILGSLLGWALGVAALPTGMLTYLGGATLIAATVIVLTSANAREARKRREEGLQPGSVPVVITKEGAAGFREGDSSSRFWDEDGEDVELAQLSAPDQTARGGNEDLEPPAAMSLDVQDGSQQQPEGNSHSRPSWFRRWFTALQRPAWNRGVLDPMEREDQALISWRPNTIAANRTTH